MSCNGALAFPSQSPIKDRQVLVHRRVVWIFAHSCLVRIVAKTLPGEGRILMCPLAIFAAHKFNLLCRVNSKVVLHEETTMVSRCQVRMGGRVSVSL